MLLKYISTRWGFNQMCGTLYIFIVVMGDQTALSTVHHQHLICIAALTNVRFVNIGFISFEDFSGMTFYNLHAGPRKSYCY